LSGVSLRDCDLTDTVFRRCRLTEVDFTGAVLRHTHFDGDEGSLRRADFGSFQRLFSLRIGPDACPLDDPDLVREWVEQETGEEVGVAAPCPAALQLRHLVGKFVRPDGVHRRSWLDAKGVTSGKRVASPEETLQAAVKVGYFTIDERDHVHRAEGDLYGDLVRYMVDFTPSRGIRSVLNDTCDRKGCQHLPGG